MKFADHLSKQDIQKFNKIRHVDKNQKEKPKKKERLSRREWEDIMGKNRDTYKRVGGAVRRK